MKAYIWFSVHEQLFHRIAVGLQARGVDSFSGFTWGQAPTAALANRGIDYGSLLVYTRDLLPKYGEAKPDLEWLAKRERELGVSIQRMLSAERHLLAGKSFDQIMRMAEVGLREIDAALARIRPDFILADDISCFHSYAHFLLARERGIPYWCIGSARLPYRVAVYSAGMQHWERVEAAFAENLRRGPTPERRLEAEKYITEFREKPRRPSGMSTRAAMPGMGRGDLSVLKLAATRYWTDPDDPTSIPPLRVLQQRVRRIARIRGADLLGVFEKPVEGEKFVLYPIHFQPEASTLVQAPMYLDQVALIDDIARSLPVGYRLYVKEHLSNRGRRPLEFYNAIRRIPSVRLLGPDADTWALIKNAAAIAVITGTMGWEGLLFDKPIVTFGDVFYNTVPHVHRAGLVPKDGWYELFQRAITAHAPDHAALVAYVAAMHEASYPGFIGNPVSFPEALLDDNIELLVQALATAAKLPDATSRAPSVAPSHQHH